MILYNFGTKKAKTKKKIGRKIKKKNNADSTYFSMSTIFTSNLVILKLFQQIVFNNYLINQLHFYIISKIVFYLFELFKRKKYLS